MARSSNIGGQAVLEGIMMRNLDRYAVAVRRENGDIEIKEENWKSVCPSARLRKTPIVRGMISFVDSLVVGTSTLMWSAERFGEPVTENAKDEQADEKQSAGEKAMYIGTVAFSIVFSIGLFVLLPYFLASFLRRAAFTEVIVSVAEAFLRIIIFLLYLFLVSRMKDIQTVFAYHGAEHKCINCIESGLPLTVENVLKSSRRHKRCGTSFLLIVIVISVIVFLILGLLGLRSPFARIGIRLLLIPLIAGLSYEFLRVAGNSDSPLICALAKPGLGLQALVTREPDAAQAEVAIAAVNQVFDWEAWEKENFPA